jgi:molecular chaperone DnaK
MEEVSAAVWRSLPAPLKAIGPKRLHWNVIALRFPEAWTIAPAGLQPRADLNVWATSIAELLLPESPAGGQTERSTPAPTPGNVASPSAKGGAAPAGHGSGADRPARSATAAAEARPEPEVGVTIEPIRLDPPVGIPLGIDLGTTYSLVAYVDEDGRPRCVPNSAGDILTPSVVFFDDDREIVGKEAIKAGIVEPDRVAACAKRDMGGSAYRRPIRGAEVPPQVIGSLVLRELKADAERVKGPTNRAVITVPAYFDEVRRHATREAGRLAGLHVLDIINEPTAAAIAYGAKLGDRPAGRPTRIMVFDLGGGTFDVTLMEVSPTGYRTLATDGDNRLGGKDWDERLQNLIADRVVKSHGADPRNDPSELEELQVIAEDAKKSLTARSRTTVTLPAGGRRVRVEVGRDEFEDATAGLLARTRATLELTLRAGGLGGWDEVDHVLLAGGSSRMPQVVAMLTELTGRPPEQSPSLDEAVAHGAALYAAMIVERQSGGPGRFEVVNVNSHGLGIRARRRDTGVDGHMILIAPNVPLPAEVRRKLPTSKAGMRRILLPILEGDSEDLSVCDSLGEIELGPLPPDLPAGTLVEVEFAMGSDGILEARARIPDRSDWCVARFQRHGGLPEESMHLWRRFVSARTED